jgi:hypothetical protein
MALRLFEVKFRNEKKSFRGPPGGKMILLRIGVPSDPY